MLGSLRHGENISPDKSCILLNSLFFGRAGRTAEDKAEMLFTFIKPVCFRQIIFADGFNHIEQIVDALKLIHNAAVVFVDAKFSAL